MLTISILALALALAPPDTPIRVGTLGLLRPSEVDVRASSDVRLPDGAVVRAGETIRVTRSGRSVVAEVAGGHRWRGRALVLGAPASRLEVDVVGRDRRHRTVDGTLRVTARADRLDVVATIGLEDLVASSVAAELEEVTDAAALEATAVAIRSFIVTSLGRHGAEGIAKGSAEGFDVCDTTHCVVSRGSATADTVGGAAALLAARKTRGLVLAYRDAPVRGYFTGACGGRTATPSAVWGGPMRPAYASVRCPWCEGDPSVAWRREIAAADVRGAVEACLGRPVDARATARVSSTPEGWPTRVEVAGDCAGVAEGCSAEAFRLALGRRAGWDAIPGARFTLARAGATYVATGRGRGHGVGLCLTGAIAAARSGATAAQILDHYYPRCRVVAYGAAPAAGRSAAAHAAGHAPPRPV